MFPGKLQVLQELGINPLHGWVSVRLGAMDSIPVMFPVLVVIGVVLGLGHLGLLTGLLPNQVWVVLPEA